MKYRRIIYVGCISLAAMWGVSQVVRYGSLVAKGMRNSDIGLTVPVPTADLPPVSVAAAPTVNDPAISGSTYTMSPGLAARLDDVESPTGAHLTLGKDIATHGKDGVGVPACTTCHGAEGSAPSAAQFPRLGGQPAWYLYKQLTDYATGARTNPLMSAYATALGDEDRLSVAIYYASQRPLASGDAVQQASPAQRTRGAGLAEVGDNAKGLQACSNCHGPQNGGEAPGLPALLHQSPDYLRTQLVALKKGERRNDVAGVMRAVAARLDNADIDALIAAIADTSHDSAAQPATQK